MRDVVFRGKQMGNIVVHLRRQHSLGRLPDELVKRLDALPQWSWAPFDDAFSLGFQHLQKYVEREGDARVPQVHVEDGFRLGTWVNGRRTAFRKGRLRPEHAQLLERLPGWTWNPPRGPIQRRPEEGS